MPDIVKYTNARPPEDFYPWSIVSPPAAGACCFIDMQTVGEPQREGTWEYAYNRCRSCGFTLRLFLRAIPDAAVNLDLQHAFERMLRQERDCL
jgi:hypothetical protein